MEDAIRAMAAGLPVLVVDNEDRENEGDIIFAAQHATPALMGWTIRYSSGVICVPLDGDRADALALPPMVAVNEDSKGTAYTVSCDAAGGRQHRNFRHGPCPDGPRAGGSRQPDRPP